MKIFTMKDISSPACEAPGCTHTDHEELFLHPQCHVSGGTWSSYNTRTGVLTIICKTCRKHVVAFQVAP